MRIRIAILVAACIAVVASADHAPEWLVSRAKPETRLMGIPVDGFNLAQIEARFGQPSDVKRDAAYPNEAEYTWKLRHVELTVMTMFPLAHNGPAGEHVYGLRIRSVDGSHGIGTAAGVYLGDSLERLVAKYGTRYQTAFREDLSAQSSTVIFVFSDETELAAGFSDNGRIISLELVASQE